MNYIKICRILIVLALAYPQAIVHAQTQLIHYNTTFTYYAAESEDLPADWFEPGFDDSGWPLDTHSIGFGYNADVQIPVSTKSLFLRYRFNLTNPAGIDALNFSGDFDDGYVAWLNGKQIIRKNAPDGIINPAYNTLSSRSHEREFGTGFPVYGVYLDSLMLDTCLVAGENVIAVQVLNDSASGSDLYFNLRLYVAQGGNYDIYNNAYRYKKQYAVDSVGFPLVIIETDEYGIPYRNVRVKALMGIIDNGEDEYNTPSDSCNVFYGPVDIEVRGQSSAEFPKRSYRFELKDEYDGDSNVTLLGMPANDDWILFGPFHDKAQFRNKMMFDLGRKLGHYQPRSEFCEVILNGEFIGLYAITETIKRGDDRVDIARLRVTEISGIDVTGGYILKYDKPNGFQIDYPKPHDLQPEQNDYIIDYMKKYNAMVFTDDFWDSAKGFRRYVDEVSLVDYMIMTEFCKNGDGYVVSTYFSKDRADRDDRLHFGPLWDHDLVFGNTIFQEGNLTDGWQFEYPNPTEYIYIKRFLEDEAFAELFKSRWHMARESFLSNENLEFYIDSMVNYLAGPVQRNYEVWPVIGEDIFHPNYISTSYENEIYNMSSWIYERLAWIDDNIDNIYYDTTYYATYLQELAGSIFDFGIYPNPISNFATLTFLTERELPVSLTIFTMSGQKIYKQELLLENGYMEVSLTSEVIAAMNPGVYIIRVSSRNQFITNRKFVKQ